MPKLQQSSVHSSIRRHSGIWRAADEAVLNTVHKKSIFGDELRGATPLKCLAGDFKKRRDFFTVFKITFILWSCEYAASRSWARTEGGWAGRRRGSWPCGGCSSWARPPPPTPGSAAYPSPACREVTLTSTHNILGFLPIHCGVKEWNAAVPGNNGTFVTFSLGLIIGTNVVDPDDP